MAFVYWIHLPEHTDMFSEGYIGFTSQTVAERWQEHQDATFYRNSPLTINNAIRKHGDKLLVTTILEGDTDYCLDVEYKLRPMPNTGYNIAIGGGASPMMGRTHSEASIEKMRVAKRGELHPCLGKPRSPEVRAAIAKTNTGKKHTEETRAKLSGENHWLHGKSHPEHRKKAISDKLKGRKPSASELANKKAYNDKTFPWEYTVANKTVWALAVEIYEAKVGTKSLAKLFQMPEGAFEKIYKKIKAGWNPSEDLDYLAWLESYKNKEPYGT